MSVGYMGNLIHVIKECDGTKQLNTGDFLNKNPMNSMYEGRPGGLK
jgi:hypothetical protein